MAYNFPNSPSNGDTVTINGVVYTYNSTDNAWRTGGTHAPAILSDGSTPTLNTGITAEEVRTLIGSPDLSSVDTDIVPDGDATRDLGSSSAKFKDLYLDNFKGVNISAKKNPINIAVTETAMVIRVA